MSLLFFSVRKVRRLFNNFVRVVIVDWVEVLISIFFFNFTLVL